MCSVSSTLVQRTLNEGVCAFCRKVVTALNALTSNRSPHNAASIVVKGEPVLASRPARARIQREGDPTFSAKVVVAGTELRNPCCAPGIYGLRKAAHARPHLQAAARIRVMPNPLPLVGRACP